MNKSAQDHEHLSAGSKRLPIEQESFGRIGKEHSLQSCYGYIT